MSRQSNAGLRIVSAIGLLYGMLTLYLVSCEVASSRPGDSVRLGLMLLGLTLCLGCPGFLMWMCSPHRRWMVVQGATALAAAAFVLSLDASPDFGYALNYALLLGGAVLGCKVRERICPCVCRGVNIGRSSGLAVAG